MSDSRRSLPSIDRLLQLPEISRLLEAGPRNLVVAAARLVVEQVRAGRAPIPDDWASEIAEQVAERSVPSLQPVINATGVVLHTNLGRAPLARTAIEAVIRVASGYGNLELDLATGARGSRLEHGSPLLAALAGTEDALIVNNAAGALVLALNAVAAGREVVISRGELVEIGGSFRIPDILEKSGAVLREVGTTNRTHLSDYDRAIGATTGAILVVHRSNFEMTGFVTAPEPAELRDLALRRGVPLLHDVGSGLLLDLAADGLAGEPIVRDAARFADLVLFSGDKLLGGPQAGAVVGRKPLIGELKRNPFARAMRADKMTLAAMEATLRLYQDPAAARREIPVLRMLTLDPAALRAKAALLAGKLEGHLDPRLEPGRSAVGGGSFPGAELPTTLVTLAGPEGPNVLALKLRLGSPSVLARVEHDRMVLDPRTIADAELDLVAAAVTRAATES